MLSSEQKIVAMAKLATFRVEALLDLFHEIDSVPIISDKYPYRCADNINSLLDVLSDLCREFFIKVRDEKGYSFEQIADCLEQYIKELSNNVTNNPS